MLVALALAAFSNTLVLERGAVIPGYGRYVAVEDTVLDSQEGDLWQGGASALIAGKGKPVLIQFLDLQRVVGRNKRVSKATLEFVYTKGQPKLAGMRRVLVPWTEGPIVSVAGQLRGDDASVRWAATYRMRRNGIDAIPWQSGGGRGDTESEAFTEAKDSIQGDKFVITGLEGAVQRQLDRWYDNHGFAFELEGDADLLSSGATEGRPRLILELEDKAAEKGPDLSVTSIARSPEYERYDDRDATSTAAQDGAEVPVMDKVKNATAKKWPDDGEIVTYTAHIKNIGTAPAQAFEAQWLEREVGHSLVAVDKALAAGEETTVSVQIAFRGSHSDHRVQPVSLRLFPKGADANRNNDLLEIQQGALNFQFVVTPSVAEAISNQGWAVEDWVQDQLRHWNEVTCRYARYSFAPDGVLERVRAQAISVGDKQPELNLAFDAQLLIDSPDTFELKMAEAVGLVPLITPLMSGGGTTADGTPIPSALDPFPGLTHGGEIRSDALLVPTLAFPYDAFSDLFLDPDRMELVGPLAQTDVYALNRNLGRRRGFKGEYLYDVPQSLLLTLADMGGTRLPNADVTFYQMVNGTFEGVKPTFSLKSNDGGLVVLPRRDAGVAPGFYTASGHPLAPNPFGRIDYRGNNGAFLVKTSVNGVTATAVLKLWQVVDAAARARKPVAMMTLRFNVPSVPLTEGNAAKSVKGPEGALPALMDGDPKSRVAPPAWIEIDLGEDKVIGEVAIMPTSVKDASWNFDVLVYGAKEKLDIARSYAKERNLTWSLAVRGEGGALKYRGMPQKARFVRIVSKSAAQGVELGEVSVRTGQ